MPRSAPARLGSVVEVLASDKVIAHQATTAKVAHLLTQQSKVVSENSASGLLVDVVFKVAYDPGQFVTLIAATSFFANVHAGFMSWSGVMNPWECPGKQDAQCLQRSSRESSVRLATVVDVVVFAQWFQVGHVWLLRYRLM